MDTTEPKGPNTPAQLSSDDNDIDRMLSMVDMGSDTHRASLPPSPLLAAFEVLIVNYQECMANRGNWLSRGMAMARYGMVFTSFTDKFKADLDKDNRGEFARIGKDRKLRPVDAHGRAFFFQAVSYRME